MLARPDQANDKQLRGFAVLLPFALLLVQGIVWHRTGVSPRLWPAWVLWLDLGLLVWAVLGVVRPRTIRPLYLLLGWATWPIGLVLSTLVVGVLFYLIVTPIGFALRLSGRDPLRLRRESAGESLWVERESKVEKGRYSRMF